MQHVFIQTNAKQEFGAKLAAYALTKHSPSLPVTLMRVEDYPEFTAFAHAPYLRNGILTSYDPQDLQSFTLTRFKPPELMGYRGEALVIDPDIFALTDVSSIFTLPREGKPVLACSKKDAWDSSVMVLDCAQLTNWNVGTFLEELKNKRRDYMDYSTLRFMSNNVAKLARDWNSLDAITPDTKFLHTTERLTQPWKTGLPIDFVRNDPGKKWGLLPRRWIYKATGRYPTHYQPHPDPAVEQFFFMLAGEALSAGAISEKLIQEHVAKKYIRSDFLERLRSFS